jgi:sugar phosphate isomerase/epimerase
VYSRRYFGKFALGAIPVSAAFARISSTVHGVQIGLAGFSLNGLPRKGILDTIVKTMVDIGLGDCLLFAPSTEPAELADRARPARGAGGRAPLSPEQAAAVEELRQWRLSVPLDYYKAIRKKFNDAGIEISGFDAALGASPSDEELARACAVTKALGARFMMTPLPRSMAKRLAPIAGRQGVKVGLQGRPNLNATDPDAISKPRDYEEAVALSKNFGTSIDVGDATAGGYDAFKFVQDYHAHVFALNLKDRTKAGLSVPWGEGDSHIKEILQLIRDKKYPIRCYIDCEYATAPGGSRIADVKRCFEYAKAALA